MCSVSVEALGYCRASREVASGDETARIELVRSASVSGIVLMPDGSPATKADVRLCNRRGGGPTAVADENGRFHLGGIDARDGSLRASLGDLVASMPMDLPEGGRAVDVRLLLELQPRARSCVHARVVDRTGRAIADARVQDVEVRSNGVATVSFNLPAGSEVTLTAESDLFLDASVAATTSAFATAQVAEIVLAPGVLVSLDVRGTDGSAVTEPHVSFRGGESARIDRTSWCLDPDASYSVCVSAPMFLESTVPEYRPPLSDGVIAVRLRPRATVRGRAVDESSKPVRRVWAEIRGDNETWGELLDCEPDGTFLLTGVGEGSGVLVAGRHFGAQEAIAEVATVSGGTANVGTLVLVPPTRLTGRVVDRERRPVGGACVWLEGRFVESEAAFTRADGTFRLLIPSFASGQLHAGKAGAGSAGLDVEKGPARWLGDLVLEREEPEPEIPEEEVVER